MNRPPPHRPRPVQLSLPAHFPILPSSCLASYVGSDVRVITYVIDQRFGLVSIGFARARGKRIGTHIG